MSVRLAKAPTGVTGGFGLSVGEIGMGTGGTGGGLNLPGGHPGGVYIVGLRPGGVAGLSGLLAVGMRIDSIDGHDMLHKRKADVVQVRRA